MGRIEGGAGGVYTAALKQATCGGLLQDSGLTPSSVTTLRGQMGWEAGGRFKMGGTHVYLWLTRVDVWQRPAQYCRAVVLLKKKQKKTYTLKKKLQYTITSGPVGGIALMDIIEVTG